MDNKDTAFLQGIDASVAMALREDVGTGDITAALIPPDSMAQAVIILRQPTVICGGPWVEAVYAQLDSGIDIDWHCEDGQALDAGMRACELHGPARSILTGERTALNFLQLLSATATQTRRFVDAVAGTETSILDTRKTLPGLREAQKYAVRQGGGRNHRGGLFDAILIKENHIRAAGSIATAVRLAREAAPHVPVEVEAENVQEVEQAVTARADWILLDNFGLTALREAVTYCRGRGRLEASGNVSLETVRLIAETGVDAISIGAITKDIAAVDLSLQIEAPP